MSALHSLLLTPEQIRKLKVFLAEHGHSKDEHHYYKECLLCEVAAKLEEIGVRT
jgi:hypothetical protein